MHKGRSKRVLLRNLVTYDFGNGSPKPKSKDPRIKLEFLNPKPKNPKTQNPNVNPATGASALISSILPDPLPGRLQPNNLGFRL